MVKRSVNKKSGSVLTTSIISTIENPIPTKELLARLQTLADTLSAAEQDAQSPQVYDSVARDLAAPKLLKHSNKGVRAYACCAVADILRLYAPDAPYTPEELSRVFAAFISEFSHLSDPQNPQFLQQCYLLKKVVEVRLVIIIVDLPDSLKLISDLFDTIFQLAAKGFPERLEHLAAEMLAEVVAEAESIPPSVVTLLLKKLTASAESGLTVQSSNISNPGLAFSLAVCEANVDKMARCVAQLFSEMLDESTRSKSADYEASFLTIEKIHSWSIQIWKYVPDLLTSIMGLFNDELNSDSERVRILATTTIGSMVANSNEGSAESTLVHFISTHKTTWQNWLKKSSDASPVVRAKWVEKIPAILCSQVVPTDMASEFSAGLAKCLSDTNEKVRFTACKACEELPFSIFSSKVCSEHIMNTLFQLVRERNADIHNLTVRILSNIYDSHLDLVERAEVVDFGDLNESDVKKLELLLMNELPNVLLQLNYVNDKSLTASVDVALFEKLIPFQDDSVKRVSRLCKFYSALDEKSKAAFFAIVQRQKRFSDAVMKFAELTVKYRESNSLGGENKENEATPEGKETKAKIEKVITWLTATFPSGINAYECLERIFQLRNIRLIKLMEKCVSPDTDFKSVKNSLKELLIKLGEAKTLKMDGEVTSVTTADMVSTMKILLYRASNILFNKSSTSELVKIAKDESHIYQQNANEIINQLSSIFPDVFKNQIKALSDLIVIRKTDIEVSLLQSYSHFMKKYPEHFPDDTEFAESLKALATKGSPLQARYAIKIMSWCSTKELYVSEIIKEILPLESSGPDFATHLSALAEIYLIEPFALEAHSNEISAVIVDEVLRTNRLDGLSEELRVSEKWVENSELRENHKELHALDEKLISIRLIVNRIRSTVKDDMEAQDAAVFVEKPLKLLTTIITNSGEIVKFKPDLLPTPPFFQQRLRLAAGLSILKLAKCPSINLLINNHVISILTRMMHDKCEGVRREFLKSLTKNLSQHAISERFLHLIFFMGHEPNESIKREAVTWVGSNYRRCTEKKDLVYERVLSRLIHAIAHEERFCKMISESNEDPVGRETEAYLYALSYISMYLDSIAQEENVSLLYYIASRVKQYRDAQVDPELYSSEELPDTVTNLYRVTELCQLIIKELADAKGWSLQTWPGKMKLPLDLYAPMENYQEAQRIISKVYIGDDVQIKLRQNLARNPGKAQKRKIGRTKETPNKKAKTSKPRIRKAKRSVEDDDAEESETAPSGPIRRSNRVTSKVSYNEAGGSDGESEDDQSEASDAEMSD